MVLAIASVVVPACLVLNNFLKKFEEKHNEHMDESIEAFYRSSINKKAQTAEPKDVVADKYTWVSDPVFGERPVLLDDKEFGWWVRTGAQKPDPNIIAGILRKQPARLKEEGCSAP